MPPPSGMRPPRPPASPQCLTIDPQDRLIHSERLGRRVPQGLQPRREARLKSQGIQRRKNATEDIFSGDTIRQIQVTHEKILLQQSPLRNRRRTIRSRENRHERDDHHAHEGMSKIDFRPWIFQARKMLNHTYHVRSRCRFHHQPSVLCKITNTEKEITY